MDKIFVTGSAYFVEKYINQLKPKDDDDASIEMFFGDELNKNDFLSYINSIDLFGSKKYAVIRNASKIKDFKDIKSAKQLISHMEKASETSIIVTSIVEDKKTDDKLIKLFSTHNFKVFAEDTKKAKITPQSVVEIFKNKSININYKQAEIIFDNCMGNLSIIEQEAEKISIYQAIGKSKIDIIEFISGEKEENIFNLTDAFGLRDTKKSLLIYNSMTQSDDNSFKIFFAISRRMTQIYYSFISQEFIDYKFDFQLRNILKQKEKWTVSEAAYVTGEFAKLDKDIKTGLKNISNALFNALLLSNKSLIPK